MVEIYTNSMLKDWHQCKTKYYFKYVRKIIIPKKEDNFELGKKVHALISYRLNGFKTELLEAAASEEVLKHYKSILNHRFLTKYEPFVAEWGFNVQIKDTQNIFMGRIDAIFFNPETKKYVIADWKTGMKIPDTAILDEQAQIYLYSFFKAQNDLKIKIKPEHISFTFVKTPDLSESSVEFSEELLNKFEEEFLRTIKEIKAYNHNTKPKMDDNCRFCEYRFMCNKV